MAQRFFQWLVGDMTGEVEVLTDIRREDGDDFFEFASGECCNAMYVSPAVSDPKALRGKAMVEVPNRHDVWRFEEVKTGVFTTAEDKKVEVPPLEDILNAHGQNCNLQSSALGSKKSVAPVNNLASGTPLPVYEDYHAQAPAAEASTAAPEQTIYKLFQTVGDIEETVPEAAKTLKNEATAAPTPADITDPVRILVNSCRKFDTELPVRLVLSLPSKHMYNIAANEFENGSERFVSYIAEKISTAEIVEAIKGALEYMYSHMGDTL